MAELHFILLRPGKFVSEKGSKPHEDKETADVDGTKPGYRCDLMLLLLPFGLIIRSEQVSEVCTWQRLVDDQTRK